MELETKSSRSQTRGSPPYMAACQTLQKTKDAMEGPEKFHFVYTCVMRGEKVHFILHPAPAGDVDGDGLDEKSPARHAAIDSGLTGEIRAAVLLAGISLLLPRNPTLAEVPVFSPCVKLP